VQEALHCFLQISQTYPDHLMSYVRAARCYLKLGDYSMADSYISEVIEKDETIIDALRIKAFLLFKKGEKQEAHAFLDKILARDPENEWAKKMIVMK